MATAIDFESIIRNARVDNAVRSRTNFASIFEKYDREFPDSDEINLSDFSIVKDRGHLKKIKTQSFGHSRLAVERRRDLSHLLLDVVSLDSDEPDTSEDICTTDTITDNSDADDDARSSSSELDISGEESDGDARSSPSELDRGGEESDDDARSSPSEIDRGGEESESDLRSSLSELDGDDLGSDGDISDVSSLYECDSAMEDKSGEVSSGCELLSDSDDDYSVVRPTHQATTDIKRPSSHKHMSSQSTVSGGDKKAPTSDLEMSSNVKHEQHLEKSEKSHSEVTTIENSVPPADFGVNINLEMSLDPLSVFYMFFNNSPLTPKHNKRDTNKIERPPMTPGRLLSPSQLMDKLKLFSPKSSRKIASPLNLNAHSPKNSSKVASPSHKNGHVLNGSSKKHQENVFQSQGLDIAEASNCDDGVSKSFQYSARRRLLEAPSVALSSTPSKKDHPTLEISSISSIESHSITSSNLHNSVKVFHIPSAAQREHSKPIGIVSGYRNTKNTLTLRSVNNWPLRMQCSAERPVGVGRVPIYRQNVQKNSTKRFNPYPFSEDNDVEVKNQNNSCLGPDRCTKAFCFRCLNDQ